MRCDCFLCQKLLDGGWEPFIPVGAPPALSLFLGGEVPGIFVPEGQPKRSSTVHPPTHKRWGLSGHLCLTIDDVTGT
jgi:hypothetical protein